MTTIHGARPFTVLALLCTTALAQPTWARTPQDAFHEAYYLEHERGDFAAAAKLYEEVLASGAGTGELRDLATRGLRSCREEIAASDLAALMPAETLVYAELNQPGQHLARLLNELGLLAEAQPSAAPTTTSARFGVSPQLIQHLFGIRGLAVAVTGFDPATHMPTGVAILHPGRLEVVPAALQTFLPAGAAPVESGAAHQTYFIADARIYVALTSKLIIAGPDKTLVDGVVSRLSGAARTSFAGQPDTASAFKQREGATLFVCANARKLVPLFLQLPGAADDLGPARVLLDLDHVDWLTLRGAVTDGALDLSLAVKLAADHQNYVYNFVRTPPLSSEIFSSVPKGAAIVLAGAVGDPAISPPRPAPGGTTPPRTLSALDIGREIFANVRDVVVFAMPPAGEGGAGTVPSAAAVFRVHDAGRSQALWTQILGLVSLFTGAPTTDGAAQKIAGLDAREYRFPEGVTAYVASSGDRLIVATTREALQGVVVASGSGPNILQDPAFSAAISTLDEDTSKALLANPGRCLSLARPFMSPDEAAETQPFAQLLGETVASVRTHEAHDQFGLALSVTGLPDVGPLVAQVIAREREADQARHALAQARNDGRWNEALQALDSAKQREGDNPESMQARFEILALGMRDHEQASACGQQIIKRFADDPHQLNNFAWELLTNDDYGSQFNNLALSAADQACRATDHKDWMILDTLALAKFKSGDVQAAVELQEKAIELSPKSRKDELKGTLARFQAAGK